MSGEIWKISFPQKMNKYCNYSHYKNKVINFHTCKTNKLRYWLLYDKPNEIVDWIKLSSETTKFRLI